LQAIGLKEYQVKVCIKKKHLIAFDSAYQGLCSGSLDQDAAAIRMFAENTDRIVVF